MVDSEGVVLFANAATQEMLGLPRRSIQGQRLENLFLEHQKIMVALASASEEHASVLRFDANLKRSAGESMPVHVVVSPSDVKGQILFELLPLEQQARKEREDRILDKRRPTKSSFATWPMRSKTLWVAFEEPPSCFKWRLNPRT